MSDSESVKKNERRRRRLKILKALGSTTEWGGKVVGGIRTRNYTSPQSFNKIDKVGVWGGFMVGQVVVGGPPTLRVLSNSILQNLKVILGPR